MKPWMRIALLTGTLLASSAAASAFASSARPPSEQGTLLLLGAGLVLVAGYSKRRFRN